MTRGAGSDDPRPLFCFNGGFFTQKQVRRILDLSGYAIRFGAPGPNDLVGVWGKSPTSGRGEAVADHTGAGLVHIEDAWLRSVKPGRDGAPPFGLTIDTRRPYFDSSGPSDLETLLASTPFDDTAKLDRARAAMDQLKYENLSKYNDFPLDVTPPAPGYVLVIDQSRDDASITYGGGSVGHFREMLVFAQEEHPNTRILIKTHPDTLAGHRKAHFDASHLGPNMELYAHPISPYALLEGAIAVYTVSSGMGFEAIIAGHKPIVFGQPFYAGWGLSDDRQPIDRRQRVLTRAQLFQGAMIDYPRWYDPYRDRLCEIEDVIPALSAQARAAREDQSGTVAVGMSLWKRPHLQKFFGGLRFDTQVPDSGPALVWGSAIARDGVARIEDGFLRSRGLGADLIPPLSLVRDDLGIYYDPTQESRLERLIAASIDLNAFQRRRAERLHIALTRAGVTKYNMDGTIPQFEAKGREVILVPGQVEDDASIRLGTGKIATNGALLTQVRADFPHAFILYKPHPDVEAGLRSGVTAAPEADLIADHAPADALLAIVDRVATMTSLMGFEALTRGVAVTTYGTPFYAGWGLCDDRMPLPRRTARPDLTGLIHATLIAYPRYFDPKTNLPCPVEVVVARLAQGDLPRPGLSNRLLAKLQGLFASYAHLWRKP